MEPYQSQLDLPFHAAHDGLTHGPNASLYCLPRRHRKAVLIATEPIYATFGTVANHVETIDFSIQSAELFFNELESIFAKYGRDAE